RQRLGGEDQTRKRQAALLELLTVGGVGLVGPAKEECPAVAVRLEPVEAVEERLAAVGDPVRERRGEIGDAGRQRRRRHGGGCGRGGGTRGQTRVGWGRGRGRAGGRGATAGEGTPCPRTRWMWSRRRKAVYGGAENRSRAFQRPLSRPPGMTSHQNVHPDRER